MSSRLCNKLTVLIDTSALVELPGILTKLETKLKNISKRYEHINVDEVIIPDIVVDEVKHHIQSIIQLLEKVVESIGGDKYKVSKILMDCFMNGNIYALDMLKCEEFQKSISTIDTSSLKHIDFVVDLVEIIIRYCENKKFKGRICDVLKYYQSIITNHLNKLTDTKYSIRGSLKFFVDLVRDMRTPLTFISVNIRNILRDIIEFYTLQADINIIKIDKCMGFKHNDMIIYCHALAYSSNNSKHVILITKDKDFKDNEREWKNIIVNKIHLCSPNTIVIRI